MRPVPEELNMIKGIHHIAVGVSDFDKGIAFYRDVLGFEPVMEAEFEGDSPLVDQVVGLEGIAARVAMLKAPNMFVELWQYNNPESEDRRSRPNDLGYPHFALQVEDIDAEYRRLTESGVNFVNQPVDFGTTSAVYGTDPFGNLIEIYEIRDSETAQL